MHYLTTVELDSDERIRFEYYVFFKETWVV